MRCSFSLPTRLAVRTLSKRPGLQSQPVHRCWQRWQSSPVYKPVAKTTRIPDVLLVYHAGTLKTSFLGVTKMATIIVFGFGTVALAPQVWNDPNTGPWVSLAVAAGSAIPLAFVALYSNPFVTAMYLRLPLHARTSSLTLAEFTKNIPANCKVEVVTMRTVPVPKIWRTRLSELRKISPGFWSIGNLGLYHAPANASSPFKPLPQSTMTGFTPKKKLYVGDNKLSVQKLVIWDRIWFSISESR